MVKPLDSKPRLVFALTGPPGGGKGEVAAAIRAWAESKGWTAARLSFSDEIKAELLARGTAESNITRELLTQTATEMRDAEGPPVLAKRIVERIRQTPPEARADALIAEAVRHVGEIDLLREAFGDRFHLVSVTANLDVVARRLVERARPDESRAALADASSARRLLERELGGYSGFNISQCMERADIRLQNDGTLADLRESVRRSIERLA